MNELSLVSTFQDTEASQFTTLAILLVTKWWNSGKASPPADETLTKPPGRLPHGVHPEGLQANQSELE